MTFLLTLSFWSRAVNLNAHLESGTFKGPVATKLRVGFSEHEPSLHNVQNIDLDCFSTKILEIVDRCDLL